MGKEYNQFEALTKEQIEYWLERFYTRFDQLGYEMISVQNNIVKAKEELKKRD